MSKRGFKARILYALSFLIIFSSEIFRLRMSV